MAYQTEAVLQVLEFGELTLQGILPWSSNYTFLTQVGWNDMEVSAVYKPRRGERPLWDFPQGTLCQREQAAFLVSQALQWELVSPTILREGPHGIGSLQLFVNHNPEIHYLTFEGDPLYRDQLQKLVLFDILTNNADRKSGHVLVEEALEETPAEPPPALTHKIWAIDHGICFHVEPKLRTVIWEFAQEPIPQPILEDLRLFRETLTCRTGDFYLKLYELLTQAEISAMQKRLEKLLHQGIFPNPGPGRHYPWPPV